VEMTRSGWMAFLVALVVVVGAGLWWVLSGDQEGPGRAPAGDVQSDRVLGSGAEEREERLGPEAPSVIDSKPFVAPEDGSAIEESEGAAIVVRVLDMEDRPCEGVPVLLTVFPRLRRAVSGPDGEVRFVGWEEEVAASR
jgi:hypothetical protein